MLMRPIISQKKTLTCTLATASWVTDGSTIPATESTRWGRTLTAEDFPTWSFQPESVEYIEQTTVIIYNNSGSSQTISWKSYKNDETVSSNTKSVTSGNYCSCHAYFYNVAIGDNLEVGVWCSSDTGISVSGSIKHVLFTRLLPTSKPCIEVSFENPLYTYPSPLTGTTLNAAPVLYLGSNITLNPSNYSTGVTLTGLSFVSQNGYGLYRRGDGDINTTLYAITHATELRVDSQRYPNNISYREIRRGK
jgi:hypothetical protein